MLQLLVNDGNELAVLGSRYIYKLLSWQSEYNSLNSLTSAVLIVRWSGTTESLEFYLPMRRRETLKRQYYHQSSLRISQKNEKICLSVYILKGVRLANECLCIIELYEAKASGSSLDYGDVVAYSGGFAKLLQQMRTSMNTKIEISTLEIRPFFVTFRTYKKSVLGW